MTKTNKSLSADLKGTDLSFEGLDFDEVIDGLLEIKPVNNNEVTKPHPKKKSESNSKKKKTRIVKGK